MSFPSIPWISLSFSHHPIFPLDPNLNQGILSLSLNGGSHGRSDTPPNGAAQIYRPSYSPTLKEMGEFLGISVPSSQELLKHLARKGYVTYEPHRARTLKVLKSPVVKVPDRPDPRVREIPVLGIATAGPLRLAVQEDMGSLFVDANLVRGHNLFAVHVKGNSMIQAGMLDGDYAIIQKQAAVENGEAALVLVDDEESTIKRFYKKPKTIELKPENPRMKPQVYTFDRVRVLGKVVGVQRGAES
jgi:repressor LexA